ncbi:hypothetical protein ABKP64_09470 [Enterococcus faecalis]|uniref:P-loop ATPase, Sll1717 family n=2 Tax=Enterococcus faecalis TaxID=1351 RepID=UPI00177D4DFA|nr:hypothetical protein [Enterococcus faecalis]EGO9421391.1 hypothetical protein [Enterococcus faecalis]MBD9891346.1 hypothetical protein [Enterococcus faecalis]MBF0020781.1 hypothetical protein [Enterococcus faecalis]MEB7496559.1 hypothetical protein [Enterococcus faecalis]HAP3825143.1 hypothetical protein [Enterococcus faecalis]
MKALSEFEFGFADAEKEYSRIPDIFNTSFYDAKNIVERLINKHQFLLVGRKGVGKSAVNARIRYLSSITEGMFSFPLQLNDFEYTTFSKTSIDKDSLGTQKYKESWEFILLITCIKILYNKMNLSEDGELRRTVEFLERIGFTIKKDLNYKKNVTWLSKIKLGNSIAAIDLEFNKELSVKPSTYLERVSLLNELMMNTISQIYFNNNNLFIVIDGVDDILRFKKNQLNMLASLIRSIDYLNEKFFSTKIPIKIILCVREDILANITDPDLNKIKRDSSLVIDWSSDKSGLREVVKLRFEYSGVDKSESADYWYEIFPNKIRRKDSWEYLLNYTLLKPRDILQFLKTCQDMFPNSKEIRFNEMNKAIKNYSKDYFIEEMKNEVTGFVNDDLITLLPTIFQRIGNNKFTVNDLCKHYRQQGGNKQDEDEIKYLLILLYESGYVGQLITTQIKYGGTRSSVIFKYRNPSSQVDLTQTFIVHQGIQAGLGVRIT